MKILFITNLVPFPLDNGGKIKTFGVLKALSKGNNIDLVSFYENEHEKELLSNLKTYCNQIYVLPLKLTTKENKGFMIKKAFISIFTSLPFSVYKFKNKKMKDLLSKLIRENQYDIIYIDHLQLGIYLDVFLNKSARIILDQHNCEYIIMKRKYDQSHFSPIKIFMRLEYIKLLKFEAMIIDSVDKVICLSQEDEREMKKIAKNQQNFLQIPITVTDNGLKRSLPRNDYLSILFIGTLTWEPNNQGIVWFLKNVVPEMEKEKINYKLYIVGKNPSNELLNLASNYSSIQVTGYVEDVNKYYDITNIMVVPLFIGSGQRVKIIEAFSKGMPVISTYVGAEGLKYVDKKNILIANTVYQYMSYFKMIIDGQINLIDIGIEARAVYDKYYSRSSIDLLIEDSIK